MEVINFFIESLKLDVYIVLIVLFSGLFQKRVLSKFTWVKNDGRYDETIKTLVVSFLASVLYLWLVYHQDKGAKIPWHSYFVSYFFATSLYEIFFRPLVKWWQRKSGEEVL